MDINETPGSEIGSEVRRLLDQAARAYMDGDYAAAVASWQEVLATDPSNPRAREGIKKVSMLQADDRGGQEPPKDPAVEEVEDLLLRRRFDDAVALCRERFEVAGPGLRKALRDLEQQAERARAVEPEIQRSMASARRALQEGKVREALPHLKQVLALDGTHPVASRLMAGLRQRARKRSEPEARSGACSADLVLPASGRPGSDAPAEDAAAAPETPAPLGHGLPSSPLGAGSDPSAPEIELDMMSLDDLAPAPTTDDGQETAAAGDTLRSEDGEELVADSALAIPLQEEGGSSIAAGPEPPGSQAPEGARRSSASDYSADSPFTAGDREDGPPVRKPETRSAAPAAAPSALPDASGPGSYLGDDDEDDADPDESGKPAAALPPPSRRSASRRRSRPGLVWGGLAAVVVLGSAVAAWQLGLMPVGATEPEPLPEAVVQAGVADVATDGPAAPAVTLTEAETAPAQEAGNAQASGPQQAPAASRRDPRKALVQLEQGQDLYQDGRFEEAAAAFRQAAALDPVSPEPAIWLSRVEKETRQRSRQEGEYEAAVAAFNEKDFENALRKFYRLQEGGSDRPYERYIVNSWFNWGLQMLAAGNLREAERKLDEVLDVRPDDPEAPAIKKLVAEYQNRPKDRAFYLQVEALRYRLLDG